MRHAIVMNAVTKLLMLNINSDGREHGIAVWDSQTRSDALVLPWVLAFQGDNPMSSEFASHIGMTGRCLCRICHYSTSKEQTEQDRILKFLAVSTRHMQIFE